MKNTPLKIIILDIFKNISKPLSALEIKKELLKNNFSPNKTTIYRQLEKLEENWVLQSVVLNSWVKFFELKKDNHFHFTCNSCDWIFCLKDKNIDSSILNKKNELEGKWFKIKGFDFFMSWLCENCNK